MVAAPSAPLGPPHRQCPLAGREPSCCPNCSCCPGCCCRHQGRGRCTTTTIALHYGDDGDTAIALAVEQACEWQRTWAAASPTDREAIVAAWQVAVPRLTKGRTRWLHVKGQLTAIVAFLFDHGVGPLHPARWVFPSGADGHEHFCLDFVEILPNGRAVWICDWKYEYEGEEWSYVKGMGCGGLGKP